MKYLSYELYAMFGVGMGLEKNGATVIILTADLFEDMELFFPFFRLLEEGIQADIAAPTMEQIHGEHGYPLKPNKTFDEINPKEYDLLFLPGGAPDGAPATVRKNLIAQKIAKAFFADNKPVAAICHGPQTLISAGLVKGRKITAYWEVAKELKQAGAKYEDSEVVVDGNLVTARYPGDLPAFLREMMKIIKPKKKQERR